MRKLIMLSIVTTIVIVSVAAGFFSGPADFFSGVYECVTEKTDDLGFADKQLNIPLDHTKSRKISVVFFCF